MLDADAVPASEVPVNQSPAVVATPVEILHLYEVEFDQEKFNRNLEQVRVQFTISHQGFLDLLSGIMTYPDVLFCKYHKYRILHFKGRNLERNNLLLLTS